MNVKRIYQGVHKGIVLFAEQICCNIIWNLDLRVEQGFLFIYLFICLFIYLPAHVMVEVFAHLVRAEWRR